MIIKIIMIMIMIIFQSLQTSHGAKGLFQCKDGYTLLGTNMTECIYGGCSDCADHQDDEYDCSNCIYKYVSMVCIYGPLQL